MAFCTACNSGSQLNVGSKTCEPINNITCPYGQYLEGTRCIRFCNIGLVYQNGLCYTNCVSGHVDNGNGGCILRNAALNCVVGQFLLDGNCVSSCPVTFFGNPTSGRCESCASNCNQCSSASVCRTCALPYVVNSQGVCILSNATLCPALRFELNGNCVSECPMSFFANSATGKCENCPANCNTCSNSQVCTSCVSTHILNSNGSCSPRPPTTTTCASGIFELNGFCFSICPSGYWANRSNQKC